jgi:hypothetical protein
VDTPQRCYTLVKHDNDNLYDLKIFDSNRVVETVKNITLHRAVVIIEDSTYAKSYEVRG